MALSPDVVRRLGKDHEVVVEAGAGDAAGVPDEQFTEAGATLGDPWGADVVAKVAAPSEAETGRLNGDSVLIGFLGPLTNGPGIKAIAATGATSFAMEAIPRISRAQSMDALSSQATVAGYRAVLIAASVTRIGARRPGTAAVLITTSKRPIASAIASRCLRCCSSASSFA